MDLKAYIREMIIANLETRVVKEEGMSRGRVRDTEKFTGSVNYRSCWGQGDTG